MDKPGSTAALYVRECLLYGCSSTKRRWDVSGGLTEEQTAEGSRIVDAVQRVTTDTKAHDETVRAPADEILYDLGGEHDGI
jgi:hypothetical protein